MFSFVAKIDLGHFHYVNVMHLLIDILLMCKMFAIHCLSEKKNSHERQLRCSPCDPNNEDQYVHACWIFGIDCYSVCCKSINAAEEELVKPSSHCDRLNCATRLLNLRKGSEV